MEIILRNAKKILIKYLGNNKSRYYHSLRVAKLAKLLAEKSGWTAAWRTGKTGALLYGRI